MSTLHRWWSALKRAVSPHTTERELDAEVQSYYEELVQREMAAGVPPDEAQRRVRLRWGKSERVKEGVRDSRTGATLGALWRELRLAWRSLAKSPGFAIVSLLTLTLGIGASTAMFTILDAVVLKPLSYRDSGQLVALWEKTQPTSLEAVGPNPRHVDLWRKRATFLNTIVMLQAGASALQIGNARPQMVGGVMAEPRLFQMLGVVPMLGRDFRSDDAVKGRDRVVILSYSLWQNSFAGDPKMIGRMITVNGTPREVIGVLPKSFHFPNANELRAFARTQHRSQVPSPEIFTPAVIELSQFDWNGEYGNWFALARVRPGITPRQAQAQLSAIEEQMRRGLPANDRPDELYVSVEPFQSAVVEHARTGLWLLMAAVLGLMLITCLNLSNAHLGRALSHEREAAVRSALGASRWQVAWSFLSETIILAIVGAALGVLAAAAGVQLIRHLSFLDLPRTDELRLNGTVLLFSSGLTLGTILLSGLAAALRVSTGDPQSALQRAGSRHFGTKSGRRLRNWFIAAQVFGCTVLVLITGLFVKSLLHLLDQDRGYQTHHVAIAEARLYGSDYQTPRSRVAFADTALQSLRAIPGVEAAGLISAMPLEGETWIDGVQRADKPNSDHLAVNLRWVSPGYFEVMRAGLIAGRFFEERDRNLHNMVISESLAKTLWAHGNPVGQEVLCHGRHTVIGIVADMRVNSLKAAPARTGYLDYVDYVSGPYSNTLYFLTRGRHSADMLVKQVREAIYDKAPHVTIARVKTFDAQVNDSLSGERTETGLLASLSGGALLLAMLGVYGVLNYMVTERRQEIGVRMALGATREKIYALTLGQAAAPVLGGLGAGLVVSFLTTQTLKKLLYGLNGADLSVSLLVAALFLFAGLLAAWLPARRAASIDPMQALRAE